MAKKRAFVLIVVLPMLGLLAVLGSAFVAIAMAELQVCKGYVSKGRARMIAKAGIDRAIAELRQSALIYGYDNPRDPWVFRNNANNDSGHGTPLFDRQPGGAAPIVATNLSLRVANVVAIPNVPQGLGVQNKIYSGSVGGSGVDNGDYYLLKILDCHSMFNLNSPNAQSPDAAGSLTNPNFPQMFDNLMAEVRFRFPALSAQIPLTLTGAQVLNLRTALGGFYTHKHQLMLLSQPPYNVPMTDEAYRAIADFVSVEGWRDPDVVGCIPNASFPPGDAPGPGEIQMTTQLRSERVNGLGAFRGRYPINVNTAPIPVLVMALQGLSARRLGPVTYGQAANGHPSVRYRYITDVPAISLVTARNIAVALIARREAGAFKSWNEFETWLLSATGTGQPVPDLPTAYMILANANPNTDNARFNPNVGESYRFQSPYDAAMNNVDWMIDKFCLRNQTTEFCLSSMGYYEIESIGRSVLKTAPTFTSEDCKVNAVVKVFDVLRHSTQRDFVGTLVGHNSDVTLSTQLQNIHYFPEAVNDQPTPLDIAGAYGSPWDGNIQLSGDWEMDSFATGQPYLKWQAYFRKSQRMVTPGNTANALPTPGNGLGPEVPSTLNLPFGPYKTEASNTGSNTGPTTTPSVFSGSDVAMDGALSWSRGFGGSYGEHLVYDAYPYAGSGSPEEFLIRPYGAVEFWVKPATVQGSNEMLFAAVAGTAFNGDGTIAEGVVWRLDRYGTTLYSSRLYFFSPTPPVASTKRAWMPDYPAALNPNRTGIVYHEMRTDISNWRAGEWHKIRTTWPATGYPDAERVTHETFVDGTRMGSDFTLPRDRQVPNPTGSVSQVRTCLYLDPPSWSYACYDRTIDTRAYFSNLFGMRSLPPRSAYYVGGYAYSGGAASIYQGTMPGGAYPIGATANRFTNSTIDEVRIFGFPGSAELSAFRAAGTSRNRFPAYGCSHTGVFGSAVSVPAVVARPIAAGSVLGTLGFTVRYPRAWGGNPTAVLQGLVSVNYTANGGPTLTTQPVDQFGTPGQIYPNANPARPYPVAPGRMIPWTTATAALTYTLNFVAAGAPTVLTPVVDDVTLTVISPPQILDLSEDVGL